VVLDWFRYRVLSWRLSITMETAFFVETLEDALARYGKPDVFNTDQGSQFTSAVFTGVLANNGITISMDGKGAWRVNVFVERRGAKSNMRRCIYEPTTALATPAPHSAATRTSTMAGDQSFLKEKTPQ
jgi:transposase InsO family protein